MNTDVGQSKCIIKKIMVITHNKRNAIPFSIIRDMVVLHVAFTFFSKKKFDCRSISPSAQVLCRERRLHNGRPAQQDYHLGHPNSHQGELQGNMS